MWDLAGRFRPSHRLEPARVQLWVQREFTQRYGWRRRRVWKHEWRGNVNRDGGSRRNQRWSRWHVQQPRCRGHGRRHRCRRRGRRSRQRRRCGKCRLWRQRWHHGKVPAPAAARRAAVMGLRLAQVSPAGPETRVARFASVVVRQPGRDGNERCYGNRWYYGNRWCHCNGWYGANRWYVGNRRH